MGARRLNQGKRGLSGAISNMQQWTRVFQCSFNHGVSGEAATSRSRFITDVPSGMDVRYRTQRLRTERYRTM